ncbi:ribosomal protein S18 acetylase RimI-like enzyme [Arthrobacter stackebrandtii]|uniref:Ribosomal protein S18 acetylase RimI-like enzyme n=1 Tax=Arthrobacter stackebrandtii TaxID=272161 RepID=A0ABS4YV78_9MICC|nr:GNAT family N-acetyltransferase [Arthrobacter stackebrandtii]MBP2412704.1 ribosomal protein S18 acetylase RimI-like enzyme [Arthrobacter stackebrandtii]PYG98869.1 GNAT family N-acetyltransferase [Arthrobacter stackebrandtii]
MELRLLPMPDVELAAWIAASLNDYVADRIKGGETAELAEATAEKSFAELFPDGKPTVGHVVRNAIRDDGEAVGYIWIGPDSSNGESAWWVWDIAVHAQHRGRGYGRKIMELAEAKAVASGATSMGLHVFGFNTIARDLYESMGYAPTSIRMAKQLNATPAEVI